MTMMLLGLRGLLSGGGAVQSYPASDQNRKNYDEDSIGYIQIVHVCPLNLESSRKHSSRVMSAI